MKYQVIRKSGSVTKELDADAFYFLYLSIIGDELDERAELLADICARQRVAEILTQLREDGNFIVAGNFIGIGTEAQQMKAMQTLIDRLVSLSDSTVT